MSDRKRDKVSKSSYMRNARKQRMIENQFCRKLRRLRKAANASGNQSGGSGAQCGTTTRIKEVHNSMDKEPKKPGGENDTERDDIQEIRVNSIPLMVLIAGVLSSVDFVDWMFTIAEMLVVFVLTYQILGRMLFTALVVTPILVVFISKCLAAYDEIMYGDDDMGGDGEDDGDDHFNDHWNNLIH